jgi:hypothetical protein
MSLSLAEALQHVDLKPGRTYREKVNGFTVEIRVLDGAVTPDTDVAMSVTQMAEAFGKLGTVTTQQEVELSVDPDNYPLY